METVYSRQWNRNRAKEIAKFNGNGDKFNGDSGMKWR